MKKHRQKTIKTSLAKSLSMCAIIALSAMPFGAIADTTKITTNTTVTKVEDDLDIAFDTANISYTVEGATSGEGNVSGDVLLSSASTKTTGSIYILGDTNSETNGTVGGDIVLSKTLTNLTAGDVAGSVSIGSATTVILGDIANGSVGGTTNTSETNALEVTTTVGSLTAGNITTGDVYIEKATGLIELRAVTDNVTINSITGTGTHTITSVGGDLTIGNGTTGLADKADLTVGSVTGDVDLTALKNTVDVTINSGVNSVDIDGSAMSSITINGNIAEDFVSTNTNITTVTVTGNINENGKDTDTAVNILKATTVTLAVDDEGNNKITGNVEIGTVTGIATIGNVDGSVTIDSFTTASSGTHIIESISGDLTIGNGTTGLTAGTDLTVNSLTGALDLTVGKNTVDVTVNSGVESVDIDGSNMSSITINGDIAEDFVSTNTNITTVTVTGNITGANVDSDDATVDILKAGTVTLAVDGDTKGTITGNVEIGTVTTLTTGNITGDLEIDTESSTMNVGNVSGNVDIGTLSGASASYTIGNVGKSVDIDSFKGYLTVGTVAEDFSVTGANNAATINTSTISGNVEIDGTALDSFEVDGEVKGYVNITNTNVDDKIVITGNINTKNADLDTTNEESDTDAVYILKANTVTLAVDDDTNNTITGNVEIGTVTGIATIGNVDGSVTIDSFTTASSGTHTIESISGDLTIGNGTTGLTAGTDLTVNSLTGALDLTVGKNTVDVTVNSGVESVDIDGTAMSSIKIYGDITEDFVSTNTNITTVTVTGCINVDGDNSDTAVDILKAGTVTLAVETNEYGEITNNTIYGNVEVGTISTSLTTGNISGDLNITTNSGTATINSITGTITGGSLGTLTVNGDLNTSGSVTDNAIDADSSKAITVTGSVTGNVVVDSVSSSSVKLGDVSGYVSLGGTTAGATIGNVSGNNDGVAVYMEKSSGTISIASADGDVILGGSSNLTIGSVDADGYIIGVVTGDVSLSSVDNVTIYGDGSTAISITHTTSGDLVFDNISSLTISGTEGYTQSYANVYLTNSELDYASIEYSRYIYGGVIIAEGGELANIDISAYVCANDDGVAISADNLTGDISAGGIHGNMYVAGNGDNYIYTNSLTGNAELSSVAKILINGNYTNTVTAEDISTYVKLANIDTLNLEDSTLTENSYASIVNTVNISGTETTNDATFTISSVANVNVSGESEIDATISVKSGVSTVVKVDEDSTLSTSNINVYGGGSLSLTNVTVDGDLNIGLSGDFDSTAYVVINGGTINGDIVLGSDAYEGTSTLDITGEIYFGEEASISASENATGEAVVNILSGFVSGDDEDVFGVTLVDIDVVNIYGNSDLVVEIVGETTVNEESSLDVNFGGDEGTGETAGGSVTGADSVSLGEGATLTGTITTSDVNSVYADENATVTSATAFVLSNSSTDVVTDISGSVSFADAEGITDATEKTAYSVDDNTTISGNVSTTYTTEDTTADSSYAKAVETSTGTITLANETVVSSSVTVGDTTYTGVALTNVDGTGGLTVALGGSSIANGSVVANSPLIITKTSVEGETNNSYVSNYEYSDYNLIVVGGIITTNSTTDATDAAYSSLTIESDVSLVLTTDSAGNMANLVNVGDIINNGNIVVSASASTLLGKTYTIADNTTLTNNDADELDSIKSLNGNFSYANGEVTADEITYFQKNKASTTNETALAYALDNITADGVNDADMIDFKVGIDNADLSDYIMSSNSYIAEVNTMLLSNQNFANVNRARAILAKSANAGFVAETTEVDVVEEATGVAVVESEEIAAIKYSNVAQLQVISLMGNKNSSNGVAGYDYYSVGSTANFDSILSDNALVGASIGGTYNKVEGDAGDNANSTTFLLNAYAVYEYEGFEAFANIGYAHFWNKGSKAGSGSADWDSDAFNFLVGASYKMQTTVEGLSINPVAMLNLVYLDADSASYSNGVTVDSESYFSAKLMLGFEVEYAINAQFNVLARAMYSHECGDTSYDNTYSLGFVNGLRYIGSEAGADSAVMGLGLSYDFSETCTAYFDYNAYAYSNLITHSLNLSVALKF